jgi:ABC-type multidrug transport system permease subunit
MSSIGKAIITLIMCLGAAATIIIGVVLWDHHYRTSGLFIGFGVGIGCAVVAYGLGGLVFRRKK